jgi:hypothetical protein
MLTMLEITNQRNGTLRLPLLDASAGYAVRDIEGLGPVKATLTSSSNAQNDGAQPQSASRTTRNITAKIGLEPDYVTNDVQSLRSDLYDYFMTKTMIVVGVYLDGTLYAVTSGQVESFDNTLFSADPEVDISVICYDPDFYAPAPVVLSGNTSADTNVTTISYDGSSDAGVLFSLNVNTTIAAGAGFSIYNTQPDGTIQTISVPNLPTLINADVLAVSTIPGSKSITITRAGTTYSLLSYMDPASSWISLTQGDNDFRAFYDGSPIPFTLAYTSKYGAI